jgi:aspartate dehydrogenase
MHKKIGIIGCGTIGSELAFAVDNGKVKNASVVLLFDTVSSAAKNLKHRLGNSNPITFSKFSQFISSTTFKETDIIIEAASQAAVKKFAKRILLLNKSLMIMSAGALSDGSLVRELSSAMEKHTGNIYIPSGAIAGIDAIRSVKHLLGSVMLTTTKNPKALAGAPFFSYTNIRIDKIMKRTLLYQGNAIDAIKKFPANVNVAMVLSLAGLGAKKTIVRIIADPATDLNQHEIVAKGPFGEISIVVRNSPSPNNPKTSFLAALSAVECLRTICDDRIKIGT